MAKRPYESMQRGLLRALMAVRREIGRIPYCPDATEQRHLLRQSETNLILAVGATARRILEINGIHAPKHWPPIREAQQPANRVPARW